MNYEDRVTKEYVENALAGGLRIDTGSYIGTGTYGYSNCNQLTFDMVPKMVIVFRAGGNGLVPASGSSWMTSFLWISGMSSTSVYSSAGSGLVYFTLSDTTLTWFVSSNADAQLNHLDATYKYFVLG